MPAPKGLTNWHNIILDKFGGRNYWAVLGKLGDITRKKWGRPRVKQTPDAVIYTFKDPAGEVEDIFLRIRSEGPQSVIIDSGHIDWAAGPVFDVEQTLRAPLGSAHRAVPFEWAENVLKVQKKNRTRVANARRVVALHKIASIRKQASPVDK
jgi:hypothetical protein